MKILTTAFLLTLQFGLCAQDKIVGPYRDHFGNRIQLNADNTFKFTWNFDMASSWTKGTWLLKNDTVFFHMVPTYDTLSYTSRNNLIVDTLIFSDDEIPERITPIKNAATVLSSGGQNRMTYPNKLLFRKERLYKIQEGNLVIEKQKGFWTGKKSVPWFFKSDD